VARFSSNTIVKFADDTVVVGLISGNNEKTYLEEVANQHSGARARASC